MVFLLVPLTFESGSEAHSLESRLHPGHAWSEFDPTQGLENQTAQTPSKLDSFVLANSNNGSLILTHLNYGFIISKSDFVLFYTFIYILIKRWEDFQLAAAQQI